MQETLSLTSSFPKELSTTGHLQLNRRQALKMTGRLFKLRMDVNLIGGILGESRTVSLQSSHGSVEVLTKNDRYTRIVLV